ncbi:hypothetical protein NEMBOFW57_001499 [Staphylotrichum longicolle]|uniref:Heterokaryon incompatibility domain-containing protein n=1 Tax=Staphylotrichum longicolle TaxID=669026 RepID=A0AAD4I2N5_9PEZI|nr:hypothetical protein NEMBOFW57_001499 [Staphylotrichum longicolle]
MQIRADLRVAPLESSHAPRYTALSYTWDEPIQPSAPLTTLRGLYHHARAWYWRYCRPSHETIVINDLPFPAARNLATALRHLRDGKEPIDFWVDAICINQEDEAEKSSQVRMMPHIYSQANKTVIWLGTRADGSDEAMDFIHSASSLRTDDPNIDFDKLVPSRALTALFSRAWWSRVWVIQEAILSQQAVVVCGEKVVPLDAFETLQQKASELRETMQSAARSGARASSQAPGFIPPFMSFTEILSEMGHLRSQCSEERTTWDAAYCLAALVMQTSRFQCTLPRDKVYGLFGLFPEVQRVIQPSYGPEKTDVDVFKDVTVFLTRWTNRIDHILFWKKLETDRV